MRNEQWRPIKGYEGLYEVSILGEIQALAKLNNRKIGSYIIRPRSLIPFIDNHTGYRAIKLSKNKVVAKKYIHQIILEAFGSFKPVRHEVNHRDGDKLNNSLMNLEWVTRSENLKHAYRLGLRKSTKGVPRGHYRKRKRINTENSLA